MKKVRLMVDLETLGTSYDSMIFQIAAVEFDEDYKVVSVFERKISIDSLLQKGYTINLQTLNWWMATNKELFFSLISNTELVDLDTALIDFVDYLKALHTKDPKFEIWANSPSFDCVMLKETLIKNRINDAEVFSNKFRDFRDLRTAIGIYETLTDKVFYTEYNKQSDSKPTVHNGLEDCKDQIKKLKFAITEI